MTGCGRGSASLSTRDDARWRERARGNTGGSVRYAWDGGTTSFVAELERLRLRVSELEKDRSRRDAGVEWLEDYVRLLTSYMPAAVALFRLRHALPADEQALAR